MSETTGQEAPAVASETPNPEAAQVQAANTQADDTQASTEESTAETKTFTQEELNDIVKKEKARTEAKTERRVLRMLEKLSPQQVQQQEQHVEQAAGKPSRDRYATDDAYTDALVDWKLEQRSAQEQTKSLSSKTESMYAQAAKLPGFDRDDFNALPLTPAISQALVESDKGPQLMAYMTANPEEVERIASMSAVQQVKEMGRLEDKLSAAPRTSRAPAPITPIGSRGSGSPGDPASMSVDQWAAHMKKQGSRWVR